MCPQQSKRAGQNEPAPGELIRLPVPNTPKAEFAREVVATLQRAGFQAVWAGGCVRDLLMGQDPIDYDVATNARPHQVRKLFPRTVPVGAQFGVVLVVGGGEKGEVQVATFRREGPYSDGRHPDRIEYCSMQQDALRRDFTINGMFYDPLACRLYDFVGGREDLKRGILRAIGDPRERFTEDKLRLIRTVRFAARFAFQIEPATLAAVREMAEQITQVSAERILRELQLLLQHPSRARALAMLAEVGLLRPLLPELDELRGKSGTDDPLHARCTDLWQHTLAVCARLDEGWRQAVALAEKRQAAGHRLGLPEPSSELPLALAFAASFHLLAEPPEEAIPMERLLRWKRRTVIRALAARLRMSNDLRDAVEWLTMNYRVILEFSRRAPHEWKPLLADSLAAALLALGWCEAEELGAWFRQQWQLAARQYQDTPDDQLSPPPLVRGDELIQLGVPRGPQIGEMLRAIRAAQLDGQIQNRDQALAWLTQTLKRSDGSAAMDDA